MATVAATIAADISDDWEHVADDDNYSVISLPTSEDLAINSSQHRQVPVVSDSPLTIPSQPQSEHPTQSDPHPCDAITEPHPTDDAVERCGMDLKDVIDESDSPPVLSRRLITDKIELMVILSKIGSLSTIIGPMCTRHGNACSLFATIFADLARLDHIVRIYIKHCRAGMKPVVFPYRLFDWIDKINHQALKYAASLSKREKSSQPMDSKCFIEVTSLSFEFDTSLMPAVESDYKAFKIHLAQASADPKRTTNGKSRDGIPRIAATNNLTHLFRELQHLRDQIVVCLGEIQSGAFYGIFRPFQRLDINGLTDSYKSAKEVLDRMLETPIDSSREDGPTYSEFHRMNIDAVRSINLQLAEISDDLCRERSSSSLYLRYRNDPDDMLDNGQQFIKDYTMDALREAERLLHSILKDRGDPRPGT
ncbi:hypothetical protein F5B22DRAFT_613158 [Xylaria bambusicola]|uniref:uncharacterized protein n=1 Tax=Xylaria bambusicola TaxID=326684 RepID=UPI00200838F0|nr:uncharacterized protein F5B22DRAFT_613158 [Xylaria bambusicola]KAI0513031.1 hypothetical protein F5B22DRAFT_613158 [Xylaria bambusicola]